MPTSAASDPSWAGSPGYRCAKGSFARSPSTVRTWRTTYDPSGEPPMILPANPAANYLAHRDEIDQSIRGVLDGGMYILGQEVARFEEEFARYLGAQHAIGVGSGTDALHIALRACGVGPGDTVLTVSHTAVATVAAVELAGAQAVLTDIDPATATIDTNRLEDVIKAQPSRRIKAIIPVHLYGHPADMPAIMGIAEKYDLTVI